MQEPASQYNLLRARLGIALGLVLLNDGNRPDAATAFGTAIRLLEENEQADAEYASLLDTAKKEHAALLRLMEREYSL